MAVIKKYNLRGEVIGELSVEDALLDKVVNTQMVKDYLVAYRANQRQWSASTKGRAEVSHSKQKPHPQKGTGRARQGCLAAPQYKGGGVVFGPKPKFDQHVKVNKQEKKAVIRGLLSQKVQGENIRILSIEGLEVPKTKTLASFLEGMQLTGKRVLFVGDDLYVALGGALEGSVFEAVNGMEQEKEASQEAVSAGFDQLIQAYEKRDTVIRSLRNIPKVNFSLLSNLNGYEVVLHQDIILLEGTEGQLLSILEGKK